MSKYAEKSRISEVPVSLPDFLKAYNQNLPIGFPRATSGLLREFKGSHESLFKQGDLWSIDLHRKKVMDWLPAHTVTS